MRSLIIDAFAKINLTLAVQAKRPDGLHEVRTILQTVDLSDRLTFVSRSGPLRLRCKGADLPEDRTNLVWRAAEELWRVGGRPGEPRDLSIVIAKRIPARAGLGGGSSNAAATLVGLSKLWNLAIAPRALAQIAARLGADVPFFLTGGAALGVGRGDEIYPLADLPNWWVLIVTPPFGVSTSDAYAWKDEDGDRPSSEITEPIDPRLQRTWLGRLPVLSNDLEPPVARRHPAIADAVAALRSRGAMLAAMSGSGSAVFGLFPTESAARSARRTLGPRVGTTCVVRLLARARFSRRGRSVGRR
jgi:4-diphosphocytidyl-2-C-methyl-D-erythritol kinase